MRKILALALVVVMMVVAFGATNAQDVESLDPSGQTVLYWHQYNSGAQLDTINALVEDFNSSNEFGITVQAEAIGGYDDIRTAMNAAIVSGELPNLVAGFQNDAISYFLDGAAGDLTTYVGSEAWGYGEDEMSNLNTGIVNFNLFADLAEEPVLLAWPNQVSANVLSVNLTILEELGFDGPPATIEEFVAVACAAAATEGLNGYPIKPDSSNFESFLAGFGGEMFVDGQYVFTSDEAIAVFQLYQDLFNEECAYVPESRFGNTDDFAIGLNPMALGSSAGIPFILGGMAEAEYDPEWIVTTTPWTEGNRSIQLFVPSIILVPSTPEQELASWLFLRHLTETENQVTWTSNTSYFPINLEAAQNLGDFEAENPFFAQANAIVANADINIYSSPQQLSYGEIRGLVAEAVADVTTNGRDVEEVARELEEAANAAHQESLGQ